MAILIDGYNLLNATGIDGRGTAGRTELERSRVALLNFLASALTDRERAQTTVVFDAKQAPPGLPSELEHAEMNIRFARAYPSADDLIEELIAADHVPRQLVVVSSDHRLHKAARRRRATALDSDAWMTELERRSGQAAQLASPATDSAAPAATASQWLTEFGAVDVAAIEAEIRAEQPAAEISTAPHDDASGSGKQQRKDPHKGDAEESLDEDRSIFPSEFFAAPDRENDAAADDKWNPFPPGYGADLDAEDEH